MQSKEGEKVVSFPHLSGSPKYIKDIFSGQLMSGLSLHKMGTLKKAVAPPKIILVLTSIVVVVVFSSVSFPGFYCSIVFPLGLSRIFLFFFSTLKSCCQKLLFLGFLNWIKKQQSYLIGFWRCNYILHIFFIQSDFKVMILIIFEFLYFFLISKCQKNYELYCNRSIIYKNLNICECTHLLGTEQIGKRCKKASKNDRSCNQYLLL